MPLPSHLENNFDEKDKTYYEEYNKLIHKHSKLQSLVDFDLNVNYTPPKDLQIEVIAREDIENFKTKNGKIIQIKKDNIYTFKKSEIEVYLRKGYFSITE